VHIRVLCTQDANFDLRAGKTTYDASLLSGRTNQIFPALNSSTSNALQ
jgi:hypothetical protein